MQKKRNYREEYRRRMERAQARGLSRSQARGHARAGETAIRMAKMPKADARLEAALKTLRRLGNQSAAAKEAGVSTERFRRFVRAHALAARTGKTWRITDNRLKQMRVLSDGKALDLIFDRFEELSRNGSHQNAVKVFIETNDPEFLVPFEGLSVIDASGRPHLLETRPNALYRLAATEETAQQFYRIIA